LQNEFLLDIYLQKISASNSAYSKLYSLISLCLGDKVDETITYNNYLSYLETHKDALNKHPLWQIGYKYLTNQILYSLNDEKLRKTIEDYEMHLMHPELFYSAPTSLPKTSQSILPGNIINQDGINYIVLAPFTDN